MISDSCYTPFPHDKELILWLTVKSESGVTYYVVSDMLRQTYYLYKGKKKTRWSSSNPLDLNKYIK